MLQIYNYLANKVGEDVANLILDYKYQMETSERKFKIHRQLYSICRIEVHFRFKTFVNLLVRFWVTPSAFNKISEKFNLPEHEQRIIQIYIKNTNYVSVGVSHQAGYLPFPRNRCFNVLQKYKYKSFTSRSLRNIYAYVNQILKDLKYKGGEIKEFNNSMFKGKCHTNFIFNKRGTYWREILPYSYSYSLDGFFITVENRDRVNY